MRSRAWEELPHPAPPLHPPSPTGLNREVAKRPFTRVKGRFATFGLGQGLKGYAWDASQPALSAA